ncbi:hypothetical protein GCM10010206_13170 [Streptomyces cinerochromogenes]|nr:hypothetical protein GCM10010206_13170 [Streptomyces cinerochromogenes]
MAGSPWRTDGGVGEPAHHQTPQAVAARLAAHGMRRAIAWLGRFAGPLLVVAIAASCGFVIGVAVASTPAHP